MPTNSIPTLLVGLGGIGGQVVSRVYSQLSDEDKKYAAAVCLDTDVEDLKKLSEQGLRVVQTSTQRTVRDYIKDNPSAREWFPCHPLIMRKSMSAGAGQVRAVSRLAAAAAMDAGRFGAIEAAIDSINFLRGDKLTSSIKVFVICSICGGTGAGMAVQLPFYLRDLLKRTAGVDELIIRGLFIGPDIMEAVQDTQAKKDAVHVNAYAVMKELNALYVAQLDPKYRHAMKLPYYAEEETLQAADYGSGREMAISRQIPYNFLFMLEKNAIGRGEVHISLDKYIDMAAEITRVQLFTPAAGRMYSVEDNQIIDLVENGGLSRYCGAGISIARYPQEENVRYVARRWARDSIQSYWTSVDRAAARTYDQIKRERRSNPSMQLPSISDIYMSTLEGLWNSDSSPAIYRMLKGECIPDNSAQAESDRFSAGVSKPRDLGEAIFQSAQDLFDDAMANYKLDEYKRGCELTFDEKHDDKEAFRSKIKRVSSALAEYRDQIGRLHDESAMNILNHILADSDELPYSRADVPYNIPVVIRSVHPLSARYTLYKLRAAVKGNLSESERICSEQTGWRDHVNKYDYDPEREGHQTVSTAIDSAKTSFFDNLLNRAGANVAGIADIYRGELEKQLRMMSTYAEYELKRRVYTNLLARINMLIGVYEELFLSFTDVLESMDSALIKTEDLHRRDDDDTIFYVLADKTCKQALYAEFCSTSGVDQEELPDEAKKALADEFYRLFVRVCKITSDARGNAMSENEKERQIKDAVTKKVRTIFESTVIHSLESQVEKHSKVLDFDVFKAIDKEISVYRGIGFDPEASEGDKAALEMERKNYFEMIENRAQPFITTAGVNAPSEAVYWGVNSELVPVNVTSGRPDTSRLQKELTTGATAPSIIPHKGFPDTDLTCYRAMYGLCAQNLNKFSYESTPAKKYRERVASISSGRAGAVGYVDSSRDTDVSPHLDLNWMRPTVLPEFTPDEELLSMKKQALCAILALSMGNCWIGSDRYTDNVWFYQFASDYIIEDVRIDGFDGNPIKPDYYALYQSCGSSVTMRHNVSAELNFYHGKTFSDKPGSSILDHVVISGLINNPHIAAADNNPGLLRTYSNAIDVLIRLYEDSRYDHSLVTRVQNHLANYIFDYVTDHSIGDISRARADYLNVVQAMLDNSELRKEKEYDDLLRREGSIYGIFSGPDRWKSVFEAGAPGMI